MDTILKTISDYAKVRVARDKEVNSLEVMKEMAMQGGAARGSDFLDALKKPEMSFICEVKKASPSKGIIAEHFPYIEIAKSYEQAGADCVSCLTEPKWFLGSDEIFTEIRREIATPMIRKDFVVDEYQIYQAKVMGANAVLLICSVLGEELTGRYLELAGSLGLAALVETHDEEEIKWAVGLGAEIIGVNNRNLKDFTVDFGNSVRLRELVPDDRVFIAESGVARPEDVKELAKIGVDAVLIGEMLMRAEDKGKMLSELRRYGA